MYCTLQSSHNTPYLSSQVRSSAGYKFKNALGFAPKLKTDTTYERDVEGIPLVKRPPKGDILPGLFTAHVYTNKVTATQDMRTLVVGGDKVRMGRWVLDVAGVEDMGYTVVLRDRVPWDLFVLPPDQMPYVDPWGRRAAANQLPDLEELAAKRKKEATQEFKVAQMYEREPVLPKVPGIEMYRVPNSSQGAGSKLGKAGRMFLGKASKAIFRPKHKGDQSNVPKPKDRDALEIADLRDEYELKQWEKVEDDESGTYYKNNATGETSWEDPFAAAHERKMKRLRERELVSRARRSLPQLVGTDPLACVFWGVGGSRLSTTTSARRWRSRWTS